MCLIKWCLIDRMSVNRYNCTLEDIISQSVKPRGIIPDINGSSSYNPCFQFDDLDYIENSKLEIEIAVVLVDKTLEAGNDFSHSFEIGDIFYIEKLIDSSRIFVRSISDSTKKGVIDMKSVRKINEVCTKPWYFENISKEDASAYLLLENRSGVFLIRPCTRRDGCYSLSVRRPGGVSRFAINYWNGKFHIGDRFFPSLDELVDNYEKFEILDYIYLTKPLSKKTVPINKVYKQLDVITYYDIIGQRNYQDDNIFDNDHIYEDEMYHLVNSEWKLCTLRLNVNEVTLVICIKQIEQEVIQLKEAFFYPINESVYKRNYVFKLILKKNNDSENYVFSCFSESKVEECIKTLASMVCNSSTKDSRSYDSFTNIRNSPQAYYDFSLTIRNAGGSINKAESLSCYIYVDRIKVHQTPFVVCLNNIYHWSDSINQSYIPVDSKNVSISLVSKNNNKCTILATCILNIDEVLASKDENKKLSFNNSQSGYVNLSIKFNFNYILPINEFQPLIKILTRTNFTILGRACELIRNRHSISQSILRILRFHNLEVEFIVFMAVKHIECESYVENLFRTDSFSSVLIDIFMRNICHDYVSYCVKDLIDKVITTNRYINLDYGSASETTDIVENFQSLLELLSYLFDRILSSCSLLPMSIRYLFYSIRKATVEKWPHDHLIRYRVISAFIFLRLICISLVNPKSFNLISDNSSFHTSKTLTLIAKCLQKSSNLTVFSNMESLMESLNPFLKSYNDRMMTFLDQISNKVDWVYNKPCNVVLSVGYDCAIVHDVFSKNIESIKQNMNDKNDNLKHLIFTIEHLDECKKLFIQSQYYNSCK